MKNSQTLASWIKASLARRLLVVFILSTAAVTAAASLTVFLVYSGNLEKEHRRGIIAYMSQRKLAEENIFKHIETSQRAAYAALKVRLGRVNAANASREFDLLFPVRADGSRRSISPLFDGVTRPGEGYVYGIGAFLRDGARFSATEKVFWHSVYDVVQQYGEPNFKFIDNFYFIHIDGRIIIFAPDRPDRLLFYRETAPPDFEYKTTDSMRYVASGAKATYCTPLSPTIYNPKLPSSACVTPVDIGGKRVGAFATTLLMDNYLRHAVQDHMPGTFNVLVDGAGVIVAHPSLLKGGGFREAAEQTAALKTREIVRLIKQDRREVGVLDEAHVAHTVGYSRIAGPDWYLLVFSPKRDVAAGAMKVALEILGFGAAAILIQVILLFGYVRKDVISPLGLLTRREAQAKQGKSAPRDDEVSSLCGRTDEIGSLASALVGKDQRFRLLVETLEDKVNDRTAELRQAMDAKSRFLANMSHELRTPLNGVIAMMDMLTRSGLTKEQAEMAEIATASGRMLGHIINDILDFEKLEVGKIALETKPFVIREAVRAVAELQRPAAGAKGLELTWFVDDEIHLAYVGDSLRLQQILSNLLSNAIKFTHRGGVTVSVSNEEKRLLLRVSDTGIGFDDAAKARLFQRFEQADSSITKTFGGTGLGLSICRSLCQLMGGEIWAQSTPGEGSVFTVALPLARAEDDAIPVDDAPGRVAADGAGSALHRVLVVEDNPQNQRIASIILQSFGLEAHTAVNGLEGLTAFETGGYDLILMDMQMPVMDGLQATRAIRALEKEGRLDPVPIIMLSANALEEHLQASIDAGATLHISKPYTAGILFDALSRAIGLVSVGEKLAQAS